MIDVSKAAFVDHINNDSTREAQVFYELPSDIVKTLSKGQFKTAYEKALKDSGYKKSDVTPYMELQMSCSYGECVEDVGSVELGIGVYTGESTEVLDIEDLLPGIDYEEKEVLKLWSEAYQKAGK